MNDNNYFLVTFAFHIIVPNVNNELCNDDQTIYLLPNINGSQFI